jgi:hypothetical protein
MNTISKGSAYYSSLGDQLFIYRTLENRSSQLNYKPMSFAIHHPLGKDRA